jgi:iron complex outermembrane receptor protein/outer membrane receptor for ferrienterochelin and colicins
MPKLKLISILLLIANCVFGQLKLQVKVFDENSKQNIAFVTISEKNIQIGTTDTNGICLLKLTAGIHQLEFTQIGYTKKLESINISQDESIQIMMKPDVQALDEIVIVSSTRNNTSIENATLKVEVLGKEELDEESSIKPGNVASIIGDASGVQIQQSSVTTGNSNVRIQGLDGKYTQLLRDGMPLYEGFSGGFGILSTPPLDLQQIEMIKGSASTLYGGGAIGGLINLISRKPKMQQEADVLLNATTLKEFNGNIFLAHRKSKFGYTLFTGSNQQLNVDVNKDGISDLPDAQSYIVHPRIFYYPTERTTIYVGYNGVSDKRIGGDLYHPNENYNHYTEQNISLRNTIEYNAEHHFKNNSKLTYKGCYSSFNRKINITANPNITGHQNNLYNELSFFKPYKESSFVAGINFNADHYQTKEPLYASLQEFANKTAGIFVQNTLQVKKLTIETGLRYDYHFTYKSFFLPRLAFFYRINKAFASRIGYGRGYKTPNPLVQQNSDFSVLQLTFPTSVKPELSNGLNAEINYKLEINKDASLFINEALFYTDVLNPVVFTVDKTTQMVTTQNARGKLVSKGSDTYIKLKLEDIELYAGYTFTQANKEYLSNNKFVPLTPKHRFALVAMYEIEGKWRIGIEGSYTGKQHRYDYSTTPGYFFAAAMLQRNINKHFIVVLNCENIFDFRMSRVESLYVGSITNPQFKALWAPIDGRVINLSIRWKL